MWREPLFRRRAGGMSSEISVLLLLGITIAVAVLVYLLALTVLPP